MPCLVVQPEQEDDNNIGNEHHENRILGYLDRYSIFTLGTDYWCWYEMLTASVNISSSSCDDSIEA